MSAVQSNMWYKTQSEDTRLHFNTPVEMKYSINKALTSSGPLLIHRYQSSALDSLDNTYNVVYYRMHEEINIHRDSTFEKLAGGIVDGMLENGGNRLDYIDYSDVVLQKKAKMRLSYDDGKVCNGLILSDGQSMVIAQSFTLKYSSLNDYIDRFLTSVQLVNARD